MERNNLSLFVSGNIAVKFWEVLERVQEHMISNYAAVVNDTTGTNRTQYCTYIRQYLENERISVPDMDTDTLIDRLYCEMAEYSFLTPYMRLLVKNVEEINVNSWDDTKIHYSDGRVEPAPESFASPKHCIDVFRRMLRPSNITMDNTNPLVRGHLNKNTRISINGPGVIDEDVGAAASIRFINPQNLSRAEFLQSGMATPEMLDFLSTMLCYKESIVLAGETGTGKTTVMSWLLSSLPNDMRVYTIENGTREFDLVKRGADGKVLNNVVSTVTSESVSESRNITQQKLLEQGLTFDPDVIAMAEVKGEEAFEACEAARTGHGVISTVHAKNLTGIYSRLVELCQIKCKFSGEMLSNMVADAFPLAFYIRKYPDKVRRIAAIGECVLEDGKYEVRPLWQFQVKRNYRKHGKKVVDGIFVRVGAISESMQQRLLESGMDEEEMELIVPGRLCKEEAS